MPPAPPSPSPRAVNFFFFFFFCGIDFLLSYNIVCFVFPPASSPPPPSDLILYLENLSVLFLKTQWSHWVLEHFSLALMLLFLIFIYRPIHGSLLDTNL